MILIIPLLEECRIFWDLSIVFQKRDLINNSNDSEASKKLREGSLNKSTSSDIADDLFNETLKDPQCVTVLLNFIKK